MSQLVTDAVTPRNILNPTYSLDIKEDKIRKGKQQIPKGQLLHNTPPFRTYFHNLSVEEGCVNIQEHDASEEKKIKRMKIAMVN